MKRPAHFCLPSLLCVALASFSTAAAAAFVDEFEDGDVEGWEFFTGDGRAVVEFVPQDGYACIAVDATADPYGVWWAIIKRDVAPALDLQRLVEEPDAELRVTVRVRPAEAPRRVNIMINTQRTTDFHEHLREYDLAVADEWQTISFTTTDLDARPGDQLFVQLGVTDWGQGRHHVDVDRYTAEIVDASAVGPDLGEPLVYHPPVPPPEAFAQHLLVAADSLIQQDFPSVNFNDWHAASGEGAPRVLTVNGAQWAILRWDFAALRELGAEAAGAGVLEFTTWSVLGGGGYVEAMGEDLGVEFGKVRVVEILGGEPAWEEESVTWNSLLSGEEPEEVFNPQMVLDVALEPVRGATNRITLSRPVMQRLLDGTTKGLMLQPLGATVSSIYAREVGEKTAPRLLFNTEMSRP
ncbi:MAG: hypothetical protein ACOC3I_01710 [Verrucomicrobiota bacterium]